MSNEPTRSEISSPKNFRRCSLTGSGVFKFSSQYFGYGFNNLGFDKDEFDSKSQNGVTKKEPEYDPFDHVDVKHPTTFWGTIFHLVFLSAGTPALLMPSKFIQAGFLFGTAFMILIFVFYVHCMLMLLWTAYEVCKIKRVSSLTYANLVYEVFNLGPPILRPLASFSRYLVSCIFFVGWYGTSITIYVLMVQNLQTICSTWLKIDFSTTQMVLIIFFPLLALNMIRNLRFLEPCSTLGFLCNFITMLLVLYYSLTESTDWRVENEIGSMNAVPIFIGTIFFNINITGLMMSLRNEMKHPSKFGAPIGVMTISYTIIFSSFFIFSIYFSLKYGVNIPSNAIDLIPSNLVSSLITYSLYVLGHLLLIPLMLYVPMEIVWNDILRGRHKKYGHKLVWEYSLRIILVIVSAFVTSINPNVSFFLSLAGLITSSIDSIMFPAVLESIIEWKVGKRGLRTVIIFVKNFGIFMLGFSLVIAGIFNCMNTL